MAESPQKFITKSGFCRTLGNEYHVILTTANNEYKRFDPKDLPKMGQDLSVTLIWLRHISLIRRAK